MDLIYALVVIVILIIIIIVIFKLLAFLIVAQFAVDHEMQLLSQYIQPIRI